MTESRGKLVRGTSPACSWWLIVGSYGPAHEGPEKSRGSVRTIYVTRLYPIVTAPWLFRLGIRKYVVLVVSLGSLQMIQIS